MMIHLLVPLMFTLFQVPAPGPETLTYRFEETKRSVSLLPGGDKSREVKVSKGDSGSPGDIVTTGWWAQPPAPSSLRQETLQSLMSGQGRKRDEQGREVGMRGGGVEPPQSEAVQRWVHALGDCAFTPLPTPRSASR